MIIFGARRVEKDGWAWVGPQGLLSITHILFLNFCGALWGIWIWLKINSKLQLINSIQMIQLKKKRKRRKQNKLKWNQSPLWADWIHLCSESGPVSQVFLRRTYMDFRYLRRVEERTRDGGGAGGRKCYQRSECTKELYSRVESPLPKHNHPPSSFRTSVCIFPSRCLTPTRLNEEVSFSHMLLIDWESHTYICIDYVLPLPSSSQSPLSLPWTVFLPCCYFHF